MKKYYKHSVTGLVAHLDAHIGEHIVLGKYLEEVDSPDNCTDCGIIEETAPLVIGELEVEEEESNGD